ncbi:hypothetical protein BN863_28830, partial [Formosa agariphila KMM 3901]
VLFQDFVYSIIETNDFTIHRFSPDGLFISDASKYQSPLSTTLKEAPFFPKHHTPMGGSSIIRTINVLSLLIFISVKGYILNY